MSKSRSAVTGLLAIVFLFNMSADVLGSSLVTWRRSTVREVTPISQVVSGPSITLRSGSGSAIEFRTQNGRTLKNVPPQVSDLPHLVLNRNGTLTDRNERTLIVEVDGIVVPPAGAKVTLRMETQHAEPSTGADQSNRIPVWHESKSIANTLGFTQTGVSAIFVHEFEETVATETATLPTPTDYFRYEIKVAGASDATTDGWHVFTEDYAVLLENQWIEELPEVQEESPGAAPRELIVYFCDMFPFRSKEQQLDRENVPGYVQAELAPALAKAFHTQTDSWAMGPWYDEWAGFRGEKRLSVALAAPGIWYHGRALNHSGITLLTYDDNPVGFQYDRLIDEHLTSFHHELFHNLQLNIGLHAGSRNFEDWKFFTEGQAVMASSVGNPELELLNKANHVSRANQFLRTGLNKSFAKVDPYQATVYWRFLYEQCGGMDAEGVEYPAVGMQIIKRSLEELYSEERQEGDIVEKMPDVMDRALDGSACPFQTYEDSLIAFARANYALRLANGRGKTAQLGARARSYHDPGDVYTAPLLEAKLHYAGLPLSHNGAIPACYGMDFIEVQLDNAVQPAPLVITIRAGEGTVGLNLQIWKLGLDERMVQATTLRAEPVSLGQSDAQGFVIPSVDSTVYDRLALIITRIDSNEAGDPVGEYHIMIKSAEVIEDSDANA